MKKSLFDLPKSNQAFQIYDHGYWIRHQDNWWRAAWIQKEGARFTVLFQTRPSSGMRFAGRFDSLSEAEAAMKKHGKKAKPYG